MANAVKAKKSLGQHFLTDLNIARKIAEAISGGKEADTEEPGVSCDVPEIGGGRNVSSTEARWSAEGRRGSAEGDNADGDIKCPDRGWGPCNVLEIGGGMGVLTQFLLERDDIRLWGVEIDRESIAYMSERFPDFACGAGDTGDAGGANGGSRLIEGDFLKMDLRGLFPDGVKVIGNFPYNISSQIFFKVLENRDLVPEVVGMVQREVAQRIAEPPGSRTYGIMSVLLQAWYDIEYLFTVSESVFSPPPKVKSAVIRLTRNGARELGCDEALFVKVVKAAFGQRRKMLRNSLRAVFGDFGGGGNAHGELFSAPEPPFAELRAEKLSVAQFVELTDWVEKNTIK